MRPHIILLAALTINSLVFRSTEASYARLNGYLTQNVYDDNVETNMAAAERWLQEMESSKQSFYVKSPVKNLKRFVALKKVIGDTKCDGEAYEIMRANEEATGLHRLYENGKVVRRVDKVILKIFKDHAVRCSRVYPVTYKQKRQQLDGVTFRRVENLATIVMNADKFVSSSRNIRFNIDSNSLYMRYIKNPPAIQAFARENILYDTMTSTARDDIAIRDAERTDDRIVKPILNKPKLRSLVKEYLIEPCREFKSRFGQDLFVPARFDARLHHEIDHANVEYYLGWSYFNICRAVLDDEVQLYAVLDSASTFN